MHELIVDSFAGGGGASTGIEMALGRSPDYAINHDREALALHAANHPDTVHLSENIYKEVRAFLMKYYGNEVDGHDPADPIGTVTTRDRFGIVTVEGEDYVITDIGMRMLTPRELFKAQGFPPDYEIETGVFEDGARRTLTKTAQVRMCGNSVCPPIAAALVSANCNDLAVARREAAE